MRNEFSANHLMARRVAYVESMHARIYAPRFRMAPMPVSLFRRILAIVW